MIYRISRSIVRFLLAVLFRLKVSGMENVPATGAVILCANHISNLDPPVLAAPLNRKVYFMAKVELFKIPVFSRLITYYGAFPVKRGGVSKQSIRKALELLEEQKVVCIFPEGTRRGGTGKKGAASLALRSGAVVIPVHLKGSYRLFRPFHVIYGKPVDLSEFADDESPDRLDRATEKIMSAIRGAGEEA